MNRKQKQVQHAKTMFALKQAGIFEDRVKQWRSDARNEQITKQNAMTTEEYMADVNKRGYKTDLDEIDFHKVQKSTLFPSMAQYIMALGEQFDVQMSLFLELLKLRNPMKYEELVKDFDAAMEQGKTTADTEINEKKEEDKDMANMVKGINQREETNLIALIVAGLDGCFQKVRTVNEIMYAVFQKEVEDLRIKQATAVRDEKVKAQPKNVVKTEKTGV